MIDFSYETLRTLSARLENDQETQPDRDFLKFLVRDFLTVLEANSLPEGLAEANAALKISTTENRHLLRTIQKQTGELDSLASISANLTAGSDLRQVLKSILLEALRWVPNLQECSVYMYENGRLSLGTSLRSAEADHSPAIPGPRPQGLTYTVARLGKAASVVDMAKDPLYEKTGREGSIAALPLKIGPRVAGVITYYRHPPGEFSGEENRLFHLLAQMSAIAVEQARLRTLADEQAYQDPITGLHNRRSLSEHLEGEILRYKAVQSNQAEGSSLRSSGLLLIDVDDFDTICSVYGNLAGDYIFKEITFSVNQALRKSDFLARFGRSEMALVLSDTDEETAKLVALRIQDFVTRTRFNLPNFNRQALSVSIGVAFYPDHSLTAEEWIQASQEALAQARGSGAQGLAYSAHQPQAEPENSSPTSG